MPVGEIVARGGERFAVLVEQLVQGRREYWLAAAESLADRGLGQRRYSRIGPEGGGVPEESQGRAGEWLVAVVEESATARSERIGQKPRRAEPRIARVCFGEAVGKLDGEPDRGIRDRWPPATGASLVGAAERTLA